MLFFFKNQRKSTLSVINIRKVLPFTQNIETLLKDCSNLEFVRLERKKILS